MLISLLPLRLSLGPFLSGFTTKTTYAVFTSPFCSTLPVNLNFLHLILMIIFAEEYKIMLL